MTSSTSSQPKDFEDLSLQDLERGVVELSNEIAFLEAQVDAEREYYSPERLSFAGEKMSRLKIRLEIMKAALDANHE